MNAGDDSITLINEQSRPESVASIRAGNGASPIASSGDFGDAWMALGTQLLHLSPAS